MPELKAYLEQIAAKSAALDDGEDMDIDGRAGGNIDDAYSIGLDDGEILLARALIEKFFKGAA